MRFVSFVALVALVAFVSVVSPLIKHQVNSRAFKPSWKQPASYARALLPGAVLPRASTTEQSTQ